MWTGYVDRLCGQVILTGYVDRLCRQVIWTGYVDRLCGQVMWTGYVDRLCGQVMWMVILTTRKVIRMATCYKEVMYFYKLSMKVIK